MGTQYQIKLNPQTGLQERQLEIKNGIDSILDRFDKEFSTYNPDSQISRFNRLKTTDWFTVSTEFIEILKVAQRINKNTQGSFDVTAGGLVSLWGFGANTVLNIPTKQLIYTELQQTGSHLLAIHENKNQIRKLIPNLSLDFSALAKGKAVDEIHLFLDSLGFNDHLVEIGGEIYAAGLNSDNQHWRIRIEQVPEKAKNTVLLTDLGIATSGNYRNYFFYQGKKYTHLIDPRSGYPVSNNLISATVLSESVMQADALATAFMIMGLEKAKQYSMEKGIQSYLVYLEEGEKLYWTNSDMLE